MHKIRVIISGRVQGVGFRAWTVATASHMGLKGWVRNLSDGKVEAVFCGEETIVTHMIEACKKGPPASQVDGITIYKWEEEAGNNFTAKPTV